MTRHTRAIINLSALRHNYSIAKQQANNSKVLAVIKANAYGHGIEQVASALSDADALAVATLDEGIQLRSAGIAKPIVLLEGITRKEEMRWVHEHQLELVVNNEHQLTILQQDRASDLTVWLKVDTGMHRLGFPPGKVDNIVKCLEETEASSIKLMTHLANADVLEDETTVKQIECFQSVTQHYSYETSIANSAGILAWQDSHQHWIRPGIMLYGASPFNQTPRNELKPVMTLMSEIISINQLQQGDCIGYGGTWCCPESMPVGVVAIGYGDGYPRHITPGTCVLIKGQRIPVIGRVSMDMICVDLRNMPTAYIGDDVVLWGEGLPVEEIAHQAGTISYELLCQVTPRVKREYQE